MQVKKFGRAGRTKYTHLLDQDTTDKSAGWVAPDHNIRAPTVHSKPEVFVRPEGKRKRDT